MNDSPCIGICSTTYGDFVCRGCKRFAHEVTGWNRYADAQREVVWERLSKLLMQSIQDHLALDRRMAYPEESAHEILASLKAEVSRDARQDLAACLKRVGLAQQLRNRSSINSLPGLLLAIENAFLMRSEAHYEHSFSTTLDVAVLHREEDLP